MVVAVNARLADDSKLFAALAYVSGLIIPIILPAILMLIKKDDKFVKFHSVQAIILSVAIFVIGMVLGFAGIILALVTFGLGLLLIFPIFMLLGLAALGITLFAAYKAYQGELYLIPVVGKFSQKFV